MGHYSHPPGAGRAYPYALMGSFRFQSRLPLPPATVYDWHTREGAFERLCPPWDPVSVVHRSGPLAEGARVTLHLSSGPVRTWVAEHRDLVPGQRFTDFQVRGPFSNWVHTHRFDPAPRHSPDDPEACLMTDEIEYRLPLGPLGHAIADRFVQGKLNATFAYRHRVLADDLAALHKYGGDDGRKLTVAVSGTNGYVGSALLPMLTTMGHTARRLLRDADNHYDPQVIDGADAVVHLAGDNVATGRWSPAKRDAILRSRVDSTAHVCDLILRASRRPGVLVCASAVGIYGDRGDEVLDEGAAAGDTFLAEVCRRWEQAAQPAIDAGVRVVFARFGVVLSPERGPLHKMLPAFKLGLAGPMGPGSQFWPWVARDDAVGAIVHALLCPDLRGPVNVVAPQHVTNRQFTRTLGAVLHRPTVVPMPAAAARLAFGAMADELFLASERVEPRQLQHTGYAFRYPRLDDALSWMLGKGPPA